MTRIDGAVTAKPLRLWPGVAAVVLQSLLWFVVPAVAPDAALSGMFGGILFCGLVVLVWWLFLSRAAWSDRLGTLVLMVSSAALLPFAYSANGIDLALELGAFAPWQWFTSPFVHGGPVHLVVDLLFLWCFGLIVEAFLEWKRFLALYLSIAVGQCAVEQVLSLLFHESGSSAGAASAAGSRGF